MSLSPLGEEDTTMILPRRRKTTLLLASFARETLTVAVVVGEDWFVVAAIRGETVLIWFNRTTNPNCLDSDLTRTWPAQRLGRAPLKSPAQPTYRALGALGHIGTSLLIISRMIYRSGD